MVKKVTRKEIGKGIEAIFGSMEDLEQDEAKSEKVVKELNSIIALIPIEQIEVNPFQPRNEFDEESLAELSESIETHGLIQPITVRRLGKGSYQIISGERRFRASIEAGLDEIPAYVRIANDQALLEMALVENIQRKELNPLEIAISYQRLMQECDLTQEELSKRVSKDRSTISNYMRLLKLSPEIQKSIKNGRISMGHARALAGIDNSIVQMLIYNDILSKNLSVRQTEKLIKSKKQGKNKKKRPSHNPEIIKIRDTLMDRYNTKVAIKRSENGKGKVVFHFKSDDEFNELIESLE